MGMTALITIGPDKIAPANWPELRAGDRDPFRKRNFTFHVDQLEILERAIRAANAAGEYDTTLNSNSSTNALIRIAEAYLVRS